MSSAAFIVQHAHALPASDPASRRLELRGHGALVFNAAMDAKELTAAADTGTLLLSYFLAPRLSIAGPGNEFYDRMRADLSRYLLLDALGDPVLNSTWGDPYFDFRNQLGARAYAEWILANTTTGIYLDDLTGVFPKWWEGDLPDKSIVLNYPVWIAALLLELRRLAPFRIIVGNTGGWTNNKLNGICIEAGWFPLIGGEIAAVVKYALQSTLGYKPTVNIDWSGKWSEPIVGIMRGVFFADVVSQKVRSVGRKIQTKGAS